MSQHTVKSCLQKVRAINSITSLVKIAHRNDTIGAHGRRRTSKRVGETNKDTDINNQHEKTIELYRKRVAELEESLFDSQSSLADALRTLEETRGRLDSEQQSTNELRTRSDELARINSELKSKHDEQVKSNSELSKKQQNTQDELSSTRDTLTSTQNRLSELENRPWTEDVLGGISKGIAGIKTRARNIAPNMYALAAKHKNPIAMLSGFAMAGGMGYLIHRKIEQRRREKRLLDAIRKTR